MTLTNPGLPHVVKTLTIDATNAVTITADEWVRYEVFVLAAGASTAAVTVTVPGDIARRPVVFKNDTVYVATITGSGQSETADFIAAGASNVFTHDGSDLRNSSIPTFWGCSLSLAANLTTIDATTLYLVPFTEEEVDSHGLHEGVTNPERITVPAALDGMWARADGQLTISLSTADTWSTVGILHYNSGDTLLNAVQQRSEAGSADVQLAVGTPPLLISTGDYFVLRLVTESDSSVTVVAAGASNQTTFGLSVFGR